MKLFFENSIFKKFKKRGLTKLEYDIVNITLHDCSNNTMSVNYCINFYVNQIYL